MNWHEVNFDGLVGPTHNYAGLSVGNFASTQNAAAVSNPRAAALQGLEKIKFVADLGIRQAVLPPLKRPSFRLLRELGFGGSDQQLIEQAHRVDPRLVAACYSASSMWAANAATVSPSPDCSDNRVHITAANLNSTLHRSIEANATYKMLSILFHDTEHFEVHPPLPGYAALADEGAANHTRLCIGLGNAGIEVFVYGRNALDNGSLPARFPARQTLQASQAIARTHGLAKNRTVFVQQHPNAIDAGAFHNDVVSVGHQNVFLYHEDAFADPSAITNLKQQFEKVIGGDLILIPISRDELLLSDSVNTYLFNSQILSRQNGEMLLLCPEECERNSRSMNCLQQIIEGDNPITDYQSLDLRQSMMNGGGPACLRLRAVLNDEQLSAVHQGIFFDEKLYQKLRQCFQEHYRDKISPDDLLDPALPIESANAIAELERILQLPADLLGEATVDR